MPVIPKGSDSDILERYISFRTSVRILSAEDATVHGSLAYFISDEWNISHSNYLAF